VRFVAATKNRKSALPAKEKDIRKDIPFEFVRPFHYRLAVSSSKHVLANAPICSAISFKQLL